MDRLRSDALFVALTRPVMLAGVPYGFIIGNAIVAAELFLIFKSALVLVVALIAHVACWIGCLREPRLVDLWLVRARKCPRVRNHRLWRCNSYRP